MLSFVRDASQNVANTSSPIIIEVENGSLEDDQAVSKWGHFPLPGLLGLPPSYWNYGNPPAPFPRARSDLKFCVELLRFREVLVTRHEGSWRWFHFYKDTAIFLCPKQMWSTSIAMKSNLVISKMHCQYQTPTKSPTNSRLPSLLSSPRISVWNSPWADEDATLGVTRVDHPSVGGLERKQGEKVRFVSYPWLLLWVDLKHRNIDKSYGMIGLISYININIHMAMSVLFVYVNHTQIALGTYTYGQAVSFSRNNCHHAKLWTLPLLIFGTSWILKMKRL